MYKSLLNSTFNIKNLIIVHIYFSKHAQLESFSSQLLYESHM